MKFIDLLEFKIKENGRVYFNVPIAEHLDNDQKAEVLECIQYALTHYRIKGTKYLLQYRDINIETLEHYGIQFDRRKPERDLRDWLIEKFLKFLTPKDVYEVKREGDSVAFIFKVPTKDRFDVKPDIRIPRLYVKFQFIYGTERDYDGKRVFIHPSSQKDYMMISPDHMILNEISFHRDRNQIR